MKRRKVRVGSLFMVAMVAMSMSSFEASVVSASGTQITEETTELLANQSYYISDANGMKRLSWLVNNPKVVGTRTETISNWDENLGFVEREVEVSVYKLRVAANTSRPGIDNYGNITQGGGRTYLFNSGC